MGRLLSLFLIAGCATHRPTGPLKLDGELTEPAWRAAARTGPFRDARGQEAVPYSDARFLVDDSWLYVGLYASDEDIRSDDAFILTLGDQRYVFTPASPGVDVDGTIDKPGDSDEEWIVEARVPRPHGRVRARVERCDDGRCGSAELTFEL